MQGLCDSNSQSTKRDALASNPLPTCARERSDGIDVFGGNAPVHNRLCFCARYCIDDIALATVSAAAIIIPKIRRM
jgi:hypothetical protein